MFKIEEKSTTFSIGDKVFKIEDEKHTRGLLYDSLALRYFMAREKGKNQEINELLCEREISKKEATKIINNRIKRDEMEFIELLNEAIGEHD